MINIREYGKTIYCGSVEITIGERYYYTEYDSEIDYPVLVCDIKTDETPTLIEFIHEGKRQIGSTVYPDKLRPRN